MTNEQRGRLEQASGIGKGIWFKNKDTRERECWGKVDDEVFIIVGEETDNPYKHLIQRIVPASGQTWDDSMYFYRSGYYNFGGAGRKKLVWGQYAQLLTEKENRTLLGRAREKGWPLF